MEAKTSTDNIYPTEVIDLPSNGHFYPENSPLRSGQIEIKYMTAKEEDILTSTNLIQKGIVLDKLLDSLIVTKGVSSADLLTGDLNAVMIAARILGYGKNYPVSVGCPSCGNLIEEVVDLTTLSNQNEPTDDSAINATITLPISKVEIKIKLLTRADELEIDKEIKAIKKASLEYSGETTARLRAMICSVNGDTSKNSIWKFVDGMLVRDARFLREEYRKLLPDVNFDIQLPCSCREDSVTVRLPIGANFFWPDSRL